MQWQKNRVGIGIVVLVALLGLTVWTVTTRDQRATDTEVELPQVEIDKDTVATIEIRRPGDDGPEEVVLSEVDGSWRVTQPIDAEADANNISSALSRLTKLSPVQVVALREQNYERLEVDDDQAVVVTVRTEDDAEPVTVKIGKYANGLTMVRIGDRPEVFAVKGSARFPFDRDLKTWRNRRVTQAATANVERVSFESENGSFAFTKTDGVWVPDDTYKRIEDFDPKQVDGLVSTAARLTASGFADPDTSAARAGLNEPKATVILQIAAATDETTEEGTPATETLTLEIGDEKPETSEFYLRRSDNPTIYLVSSYLAGRLQPDPSAFEKPAAPPTPPGGPGSPGQPSIPPNQLPPEVMQQLQQQLQQQQRQQ